MLEHSPQIFSSEEKATTTAIRWPDLGLVAAAVAIILFSFRLVFKAVSLLHSCSVSCRTKLRVSRSCSRRSFDQGACFSRSLNSHQTIPAYLVSVVVLSLIKS